MCLRRCNLCAGWIDDSSETCVECGAPFPSYPLPDDDEPVIVERLTVRTAAGLINPVPPEPKPLPRNRQIIVGPDFGLLLKEEDSDK